MCSPIGHNNTKHFLCPIRSRHPLEFLEMVRWESVPRGSFARNENFRPAFSPDPTDCPWVSEDGWFHAFRKDRKVTLLVDISGFLSSTTRKETLKKTHPASNLERRSPPSNAILLYGVFSIQTTNYIPLLRFLRLWTAKKFRFNNNKKEVDQVTNSVSVFFTHPFSLRSIYMTN